MAPSIYSRLTGKRRVFHMFSQLFLGPDHLLLVRSNRFEERYQRFYYKDIQAIVVTGKPARTWLQAGLAVLAGTLFFLAAGVVREPFGKALLVLLGVLPAIVAAADYLRGARCRMLLKTAVSNEDLPAVSRRATAELVLTRLKPLIEQAQQGEWTPGMEPAAGPPVLAPPPFMPAPADRLLKGLFVLVSINAAVFAVARFTQRTEILTLLFSTVMTEIMLAIATLRRRGGDPRWILYSLSGVVAVCAVLDIVGGLVMLGMLGWSWSSTAGARTVTSLGIFSVSDPKEFLWWGLGWRVAVALTAWANYLFKIEPAEGGSSSLQ